MLHLTGDTLKQSFTKDGLMRVYYVCGNDEFLVGACVETISNGIFGSGEKSITYFDAEKSSSDELEEYFLSYSLIKNSKLAIFDSFSVSSLGSERLELLSSVFSDIPDDITVILKTFVDDKRFSASKKVEELISKNTKSASVTVAQKTGSEIVVYIDKIAKREGCEISSNNAARVAEMCGNDLMLINNEMKKLAAFCDYKEIKKEHIDELCIRTAEAGVYDMISFIERNDSRNAIRILGEMLDERTEPLMISAALNTAFINLYRARLIREKKQGENTMFELFDYKKGDRKVGIAFERSGKYTLKQLNAIIQTLYELDVRLKSSAVDKRLVIEEQIVKVARLVSERI